jgi:hypothetical protein
VNHSLKSVSAGNLHATFCGSAPLDANSLASCGVPLQVQRKHGNCGSRALGLDPTHPDHAATSVPGLLPAVKVLARHPAPETRPPPAAQALERESTPAGLCRRAGVNVVIRPARGLRRPAWRAARYREVMETSRAGEAVQEVACLEREAPEVEAGRPESGRGRTSCVAGFSSIGRSNRPLITWASTRTAKIAARRCFPRATTRIWAT